MKKFTLLLAVFVGSFIISANAQTLSCQPNMDFELGNYSNWIYNIGTCCPITTPTVYTPPGTRFTLTTGATTDPCCSFPVVGAGVYSLRLGSTATNYLAEKVIYYVHVPATVSNYSLVYRYAFVLQDPGHSAASQPRFDINAIDSASGTPVPYASYSYVSGTTTGTYAGSGVGVCNSTRCKPWTTQTINLTGYNGSTIIMSFDAADCGLGGHFGYAYVDMTCGLFAITTIANCSSSTVQLSAPAGFTSYAWFDSSTFTISYGTTATISIATPPSPTHIAVIVTPATGFGPPDTLYTTVYPVPCSGTPVPGTITSTSSTACATSPFTLTGSGYTPGLFLQWQTSPNGITWSNIAGATNATYISPGISANTYYRLQDSCCSSGLTAVTPSLLITFVACCSGTPVAGTATASTTYCSSCSLTLNLSGFTFIPGMTFQWQTSPDSVTWSNIAGATTVPYTFSPPGAYYYRCQVTCTGSGLFSYSGGVKVLYQYLIVTDTVSNTLLGSCPGTGPQFYVKVNGTSPLLRLKTYYGDGTNDSISFIPATGYSYTTQSHSYAVSGTYTIKQIVYWNNIPQDSLIYSYTYLMCNMLHIGLYLDANNNCIKDPGEVASPVTVSIQVDSNGVAIDTQSATSGLYYRAYGPVGTVYSFYIISPAYYTICPTTLNDTITTASFYPFKYFGLQCASGSFDLYEHSSYSCAGLNRERGNFFVGNNLCTSTYATITMNFSPKYTYLTATPTPASVSGTTITWNMLLSSSSVPFSPMLHYWLSPATPSTLALGDTVHTYFSITPIFGDLDVTNNNELVIDTVFSPFDPNHIVVSPEGCFRADTELRYTINFENTGNDTAHNVYVMDTISANLDMHSLSVVAASAKMNVSVYHDGIYNIAKFDFPGINLLDSSYHNLCDGAVIYLIKTQPGLANGSAIFNRAGIYFDDNNVVMTNTVENMKGCPPAGVPFINATHNAEIYPNPATDELTIKMDEGAYNTFTITNNVGQVLIQQELAKTLTKVNVKMLPTGLYYVMMKGDNGTMTRKFVKM